MRKDFNAFTKCRFHHALNLTVLVLPLLFVNQAFALKAGHGRVSSGPGQVLQISLPLLELNAQDQSSLQVQIAPEAKWSKAGLTPPVLLESLTVALKPGQTADSREVVISSTQLTTQSPVDILLDVTTATGAMLIQSSYLVLLPAQVTNVNQVVGANVNQAVGATSVRVRTGDTLFGIAQRHSVPGADIYQMLLAIFEANPQAFIAGNMNLLKAGAVLNIPDAQTIRAINKDVSRKIYQQHLSAFNQRRTAANGRNVPLVTGAAAQSGNVLPAATQETPVEKTDHLKLSAANSADQRDDLKISAAKEIEELQLRIQLLQQNVKLLKEFASDTKSENSSAGPSLLTAQEQPSSLAKPVDSTAPVAPATSDSSSVSTARSAPEQSSPALSVANKDLNANTPQELSKNLWNDLIGFLAQNILAALTALIALSAMVIAWMLRRAGARRDDESEELDTSVNANPQVQAAFDKNLQSISLELNDDFKPVNKSEPSISKTV
jgi:pilus assembly protein FimV